jgi:hypothetical protein
MTHLWYHPKSSMMQNQRGYNSWYKHKTLLMIVAIQESGHVAWGMLHTLSKKVWCQMQILLLHPLSRHLGMIGDQELVEL